VKNLLEKNRQKQLLGEVPNTLCACVCLFIVVWDCVCVCVCVAEV
jgi:hypothetical protein